MKNRTCRWRRGARHLLAALLVASAGWPGHDARAAASEPAGTVDQFHAVLLDVMREADVLGYAGRRERIEPVVLDSFDLGYIARLLVRQSWDGLPESQRERMRQLFSELTVATYARRFDGYSGQSFVTTGVSEVRGGRRLVSTELRAPGKVPIRIDYLLQRPDGQQEAVWRIVNVIADGVSELALKKSEYATIIKGQGFDALLQQLEGQVRRLEEGPST